MLLRFAVSNFRSIRDEQELSLVASQAIKDDPQALIETPALRKDKALPAALIYGANASGKSNVVEALRFMCRMVLDSHTDLKPGAPLGRPPFRLAPGWPEKESRFDLTFVHEGVRYQYGFTALDDRFGSEWLYSWPSGSRRELFMREGQEFSFGRVLKGDNQLIARNTKANSLFVSAAAQNNHEQLGFIYGFFSSLYFNLAVSPSRSGVARHLARFMLDVRAMKLLDLLDTGIKSIDINYESLLDIYQRRGIPVSDQKLAEMHGEGFTVKDAVEMQWAKIKIGHSTGNGDIETFDINDESTGTVRLLFILGPIFNALDAGSIVIIDEMDSSLHTLACEQIIALFQSPKTNPKGAQLIATTHDTNLLIPDTLRRDQIWFTEKDGEGATHLYPLTDIHTRKGDNIEKGYLQGRFGAVPFAGSVDDFVKMD
jgi:AAA15 family ATPase/GTPase